MLLGHVTTVALLVDSVILASSTGLADEQLALVHGLLGVLRL